MNVRQKSSWPKDPVCGMLLNPACEPSAPSRDHKGKTYYFCCEGCASKFAVAPNHYVENKPGRPDHKPKDRTSGYICPMCPSVWSNAPNICPTCGMGLEPADPLKSKENYSELNDMKRRLTVASILTAPIFVIAMREHVPGLEEIISASMSGWLQFVLSTPVVLWAGWPFFQRGWRSIHPWRPNMFTLITIGTGAAYLFSLIAFLTPGIFPKSLQGRPAARLFRLDWPRRTHFFKNSRASRGLSASCRSTWPFLRSNLRVRASPGAPALDF